MLKMMQKQSKMHSVAIRRVKEVFRSRSALEITRRDTALPGIFNKQLLWTKILSMKLFPQRKCLNVGTVPVFKINKEGTVSMLKMHNIGT